MSNQTIVITELDAAIASDVDRLFVIFQERNASIHFDRKLFDKPLERLANFPSRLFVARSEGQIVGYPQ